MPTHMMVGELLDGRYELREIIGEGGMGVVFRATQLSVKRDVAIKVMKSEFFEEYGLVRRFKLEMEIISGLQHPNIVRLLDTGQDKRLGVFFLVMEFIEGLSLGQLLYEHHAPVCLRPELAIEIATQICGALTEPHRLGVVHRDLKPDNIILMIRSDEQLDVKLLDFGVARIIEPNDRIETSEMSRLTATGGIVGTPPYIAPELCESSRHVSAKSDLYAVGALLFELLTGLPPFPGRSTAEVLYKHVHEQAPRLLDRTPVGGCACQDLDNLIAALLEKMPDDRPESALHVKRALDKVRQNNYLQRPTLQYSTKAPTVASFYHYITVIDDTESGPKLPVIPTLDADSYAEVDKPAIRVKPPPLRTMAHGGETLSQHPNPLRDSEPLRTPRADSTTSMEIVARDDLVSSHELTHDPPIHDLTRPDIWRKPGTWIGLIVLACGIGALIMVLTPPTAPGESKPVTPLVEKISPAPALILEPEVNINTEYIKAFNQSSSHITRAVQGARDALSAVKPPARSTPPTAVKDKKLPPETDKNPAPPDTPPPQLKKKFDWLYEK